MQLCLSLVTVKPISTKKKRSLNHSLTDNIRRCEIKESETTGSTLPLRVKIKINLHFWMDVKFMINVVYCVIRKYSNCVIYEHIVHLFIKIYSKYDESLFVFFFFLFFIVHIYFCTKKMKFSHDLKSRFRLKAVYSYWSFYFFPRNGMWSLDIEC